MRLETASPRVAAGTLPGCAAIIDTPCGEIRLDADRRGLREVQFGRGDAVMSLQERDAGREHLEAAVQQLLEYFAGARTRFELTLAPRGTAFQQRVWAQLLEVPYAETVSYAQVARRLGDVNAVRAVGAANGANPIAVIIPCHRVIASDGTLHGYAGGLERKRWLLDHERSVAPGAFLGFPA